MTEIRTNELLTLKVSQVQTLFESNWITLHGLKCDSTTTKVFLTQERKRIVKEKDFKFIFQIKTPGS